MAPEPYSLISVWGEFRISPGDPNVFPRGSAFRLRPDFQWRSEAARDRMVAGFDLELTEPEFALGYNFDIVLRGPSATPMED